MLRSRLPDLRSIVFTFKYRDDLVEDLVSLKALLADLSDDDYNVLLTHLPANKRELTVIIEKKVDENDNNRYLWNSKYKQKILQNKEFNFVILKQKKNKSNARSSKFAHFV